MLYLAYTSTQWVSGCSRVSVLLLTITLQFYTLCHLAPPPAAVVEEGLAREHAHAQPEAEAGREVEAGAVSGLHPHRQPQVGLRDPLVLTKQSYHLPRQTKPRNYTFSKQLTM